jgi:hypothetical protein
VTKQMKFDGSEYSFGAGNIRVCTNRTCGLSKYYGAYAKNVCSCCGEPTRTLPPHIPPVKERPWL